MFIAVTFATSWTLWSLGPLAADDPIAASALDQLATFGPAGAALLVARSRGAQTPVRRPSLAIGAGLIVLLVTILLLAPRWAHATTPLAAALLACVTLLPAALIAAACSGPGGIRTLLGSLVSPPAPWWTYVVALLLVPSASMAGTALVVALGGDAGATPQMLTERFWLAVPMVFAVTLLFGGPLGEEVGWRGWLLPTLQTRLSPLLSSLIVGLVWGAWHLPLHLRGDYDQSMGSGLAGFALRVASSCLLAVLFTWLYNRSRGGLLVVILFHTSVNNTSGYWLPVNAGLTVILLLAAAAAVIVDRMWIRPDADHLAGTGVGRQELPRDLRP